MTEEYNFAETANSLATDCPTEPSQQVVRNILDFARCCQDIKVGDIEISISLN
ncbi:MAG: hypothetical protein IJ789_02440 [Bacteroidales bacterium]|nr:hypothetical protein [Bacteroidales bacterium]